MLFECKCLTLLIYNTYIFLVCCVTFCLPLCSSCASIWDAFRYSLRVLKI